MKRLFPALSVILVVALFAASCSKNSTPTKGMAQMLRTGKWSIQSAKVSVKKPNGVDTIVDLYYQGNRFIPSCKRGTSIQFNSGINGALFTGTPCQPSDPTEVDFNWQLTDNNTILNLYGGFNLIYTITDTILPYFFDTTWYPAGSQPPYSFDSIVNYEDTSVGGNPNYIVLDTIWNLQFDTIPDPYVNVYGQISNFSQNSFTLNFSEITVYPDSTSNHGTDPVYRPDTARFTYIFGNSE